MKDEIQYYYTGSSWPTIREHQTNDYKLLLMPSGIVQVNVMDVSPELEGTFYVSTHEVLYWQEAESGDTIYYRGIGNTKGTIHWKIKEYTSDFQYFQQQVQWKPLDTVVVDIQY